MGRTAADALDALDAFQEAKPIGSLRPRRPQAARKGGARKQKADAGRFALRRLG